MLLFLILLIEIDTQIPDVIEDAYNYKANKSETEEVVLELGGDLI